jgi:hypothetical protein
MTQDQATYYLIQQWVLTGITLGGIIIALIQIGKVVKSNSISEVAALLQIESVLGQNRQRIDQATVLMANLNSKRQGGGTVLQAEIDAVEIEMNGAVQNYLNSLDRLCACILRGVFREDYAKQDYRDYINAAIETYADHFGGVKDRFHNIRKVREKWRDE